VGVRNIELVGSGKEGVIDIRPGMDGVKRTEYCVRKHAQN
jgi:hypothetical protein